MAGVPSVAEVATEIGTILASRGDRAEAEARRTAFSFVETFESATAVARWELVRSAPPPTGDARFDALLAALVEHLCASHGVTVPGWVEDADRFLDQWWFVSGLRNLHASALAQSPISFARRGVFICDGALSYA